MYSRRLFLAALVTLGAGARVVGTPTFYAIYEDRSVFSRFDPTTGVWADIGIVHESLRSGPRRVENLEAMTYNWHTGQVLAVASPSGNKPAYLYAIDSGTLSYAEFDGHGYSGVEALAFDESGRLFGVDGTGRVLEFDTVDGSAVALTDQNAVGDVGALAFVFTGAIPEPAALLVFLLGSLLILTRKRWIAP